jgi:hypothetical protein
MERAIKVGRDRARHPAFGFNLRRACLFERADDRRSFGGRRDAGAEMLVPTSREFKSHLGAS